MPRLLLIDDSRETEMLLRALLEREGFSISGAAEARTGIELARADPPDLILMDLSLPAVPAWKSIREIKADPRLSGIPVIAMTTAAMGGERERAFAAGCDGFVTKPIKGAELKGTLITALENKSADEETVTKPLAITTPAVRSLGKPRLLLASSDPEFRRLHSTTLRSRHYPVDTAGTSAEVFNSIETHPPQVILLDAQLADRTGREVAVQLHARLRDEAIPVVLFLDPGSPAPPGAETVADDFVTKPVDEGVLLARIRKLVLLSRALRAERQRSRELAVVARQMALGLVLFDEDGRITLMNSQAADLLGLSAKELHGRSARHFFRVAGFQDTSGRPVDPGSNPVARFVKRGNSFEREIFLWPRPSGEATRIEASFAAIRNGRGRLRGISLVLRRASPHSQSRRELQEAYEHLMEVDQLKSKFLSMVSHELRTPLNTIILLSHLLASERPGARPEPKGRHDLEIIHQSGTALLHMINNLLDLARLEAGELQISPDVIILKAFLEEIREMMTPLAEKKGLKVELKIAPDLPDRVVLDRERLREVLINLVSNAIKFTAEGRVTLEAGLTATQASLTFVVRDSGIGIPPEKLSLIFEPFRQVAPGNGAGKGSGLGLSIVRELVQLMAGEITVDTAPGHGSAFRVTLPKQSASPEDDAGEATDPVPVRAAGPGLVLVVEDDEHSRYGLKSVLEMEGYRVDEASSAGEARARLAGQRYQAVFMDISLPDADGTRVIEEVRRQPGGLEIPILALTGKTSDEDRRRIQEAGATAYISKPVDVKEMFRVLTRLIGLAPQVSSH